MAHFNDSLAETMTDNEQSYGNTVLINTNNVTELAAIDDAPPLSRDEIYREFTTGDICKIEQDRIYERLEDVIEKRRKLLEAKKAK